MPPIRVAIIGGGPAGISMADQLLSLSSTALTRFDVTLFERRSSFAGVWAYDADPGPCLIRFDSSGRAHALWNGGLKDGDEGGRFRPPGPMYDGLRTNLPCDIMTYRSNPYPGNTSLFPDRATVEGYINDFGARVVRRSGIEVRLNTAVARVTKKEDLWEVKSKSIEGQKERMETFDKVVLASGRCNTPSIPRVAGLHKFKGEILHSAWWRSPIPLKDKVILVVGNSSSGSDIARELVGYILRTLPEGAQATRDFINDSTSVPKGRVLHSYEHFDKPPPLDFDPREEGSPDWAQRIKVVPRIDHIDEEGRIVFDGGEVREDVEVIIFATGYSYDFPYLPQDVAPFDTKPLIPSPPPQQEVELGGEVYSPPSRTAPFLTHLDDWSLFYSPDPSLCVLGAPIRIVPMPFTHTQSRIVAAHWAGLIPPLPKLDRAIPSTNPEKWTSRRAEGEKEEGDEGNKTSDLGYPSDTAYQNALLDLLPEELRREGEDVGRGVGEERRPVMAEEEGWGRMPDFRNERRGDTKRLRRMLLGY